MCTHPVLNLAEQDVLGLGVAEQVVQFDRWFGTLDDIVKLFVRLLNPIKCRSVVDVATLLHVKLVVEALKVVPKVGLGALGDGTLRLCSLIPVRG